MLKYSSLANITRYTKTYLHSILELTRPAPLHQRSSFKKKKKKRLLSKPCLILVKAPEGRGWEVHRGQARASVFIWKNRPTSFYWASLRGTSQTTRSSTSGRSVQHRGEHVFGTIFPTALAYVMSLCHNLEFSQYFNLFVIVMFVLVICDQWFLMLLAAVWGCLKRTHTRQWTSIRNAVCVPTAPLTSLSPLFPSPRASQFIKTQYWN